MPIEYENKNKIVDWVISMYDIHSKRWRSQNETRCIAHQYSTALFVYCWAPQNKYSNGKRQWRWINCPEYINSKMLKSVENCAYIKFEENFVWWLNNIYILWYIATNCCRLCTNCGLYNGQMILIANQFHLVITLEKSRISLISQLSYSIISGSIHNEAVRIFRRAHFNCITNQWILPGKRHFWRIARSQELNGSDHDIFPSSRLIESSWSSGNGHLPRPGMSMHIQSYVWSAPATTDTEPTIYAAVHVRCCCATATTARSALPVWLRIASAKHQNRSRLLTRTVHASGPYSWTTARL